LHSGLSYKRLEKGRFRWPEAEAGQNKVVLSQEELALLVGGIDLAGSRRRAWFRKVVGEAEGELAPWTTVVGKGGVA
jgi:transposase